jgi:hypothetical protein
MIFSVVAAIEVVPFQSGRIIKFRGLPPFPQKQAERMGHGAFAGWVVCPFFRLVGFVVSHPSANYAEGWGTQFFGMGRRAFVG